MRPLWRSYSLTHPTVHVRDGGELHRAGTPGLALPTYHVRQPMMLTGNGGAIPAAQDPTDPNTWQVPVRFT